MSVVIGLDYGLRRIGIAVSDSEGVVALPAGVHVEGRDGSVLARLGELIAERDAVAIVLGLPLTADGRETDMAARVRRFAARLEQEFAVPVILEDERYSSHEAKRAIGQRGRPARRGEIDVVAAQIILQAYLDRRQGGVS